MNIQLLLHSYLVHCEISVVKVAATSLETIFSHAVVNQKEIAQLQYEKKSAHNLYHIQLLAIVIDIRTYVSQLLVSIHRNFFKR